MNSKCLPLEFFDCHKTTALSSPEKSPPASIPPTCSVDNFPPMHLLTLFPIPGILLCPISSPRASPVNHTKAQMSVLHSFGFRSHMLSSSHSWFFYLLKSLYRKDRVLKAFEFSTAFCIRPCLKQVFLKNWFSDCLWTFPLGPSKALGMHLENISLLGTKESAYQFILLEAESGSDWEITFSYT